MKTKNVTMFAPPLKDSGQQEPTAGHSTVQESLFSRPKPCFLHVVKDGQPVEMTAPEIFDHTAYSELLATTYVSSPTFFFRTAKAFNRIVLVLGIDDNRALGKFVMNPHALKAVVSPGDMVDFWHSLDEDVKEAVRNGRIAVRYGRINVAIHSKLYLLKGEAGNRVVLGSANLTRNAFANSKQFEDLLIFDNSPLYDVYQARFNAILEHTEDYIPERVKRLPKDFVISLNDPQLLHDILTDEAAKNVRILIPENDMEQLRTLPKDAEECKVIEEEFVKRVELITYKPDAKKPEYSILPVPRLFKKTTAIKAAVCRTNKHSVELDNRVFITYNDADHRLLIQEDDPAPDRNKPLLIPFSNPLDRDNIRQRLDNIAQFVEAYSLYTTTSSISNQARVMEGILYGFVAPYVFKIRNHYVQETGRESARSNFPPVLIIAGRARTGKTSLLEFLSILLGNGGNYMSYMDVSKANVLFDYFHSGNLCPILVDEIDGSFFKSRASFLGERLIKHVSNDLKDKHPVLMGTTNATGFSIPHQAERRVYYLGIDVAFDRRKKAESDQYLDQVRQGADPLLFQDFSHRLATVISNNDRFYDLDDLLYVGRQIFRDYYQTCELDLPAWFPEAPFDDYRARGKQLWGEIFDAHRDSFNEKRDRVVVAMDRIKAKATDQRALINYLPSECIKEDSHILILNRQEFFRYIGYGTGHGIASTVKGWFRRRHRADG